MYFFHLYKASSTTKSLFLRVIFVNYLLSKIVENIYLNNNSKPIFFFALYKLVLK